MDGFNVVANLMFKLLIYHTIAVMLVLATAGENFFKKCCIRYKLKLMV